MRGRPERSEAAPYYFTYINKVQTDEIVPELESQLEPSIAFFRGISEEHSLHRYAPDKWSFRQVLNHINDAERVFLSRAHWFARAFQTALPSFDQEPAVNAAKPDAISWAAHIEEFRAVRRATIAFYQNLPADAWMRGGIASDNPFTVRALAYIIAGHLSHHIAILKQRYM